MSLPRSQLGPAHLGSGREAAGEERLKWREVARAPKARGRSVGWRGFLPAADPFQSLRLALGF